jgi:DNA-binding transcriptional regulator YiaG
MGNHLGQELHASVPNFVPTWPATDAVTDAAALFSADLKNTRSQTNCCCMLKPMTGPDCKALRQKLGIKQVKLCWDCQLDPALVSKWESGLGRLRAVQVEVIRGYLARHLLAAKQEFAALELPELDAAIDQVTR